MEVLITGELGSAYLSQGNIGEAAKYFSAAARIAHRLGPSADEETWLGNLAVVYAERRQFGAAMLTSEKASALAKAKGNAQLLADQLRLMGTIHADKGNTRLSLAILFKALDAHSELGDLLGVAFDLREISGTFARHGDLSRCAEYLRLAIGAGRAAGAPQAHTSWPAILESM